MGMVAAVGPLLVLLVVVFQVEEVEDTEFGSRSAEVTEETGALGGVSPWIPIAALALAAGAIVIVWFWARRAVDPIERMTALSDEVQAGSLDRRMRLDDAPVEVRRLANSFDQMLDRLAQSSALERRLIEDASHELRTPIAALAARLDVAARRTEPGELAADLAQCEAEVERLQASLDALLASARSRQSVVSQVDNDIVALVKRVVERQRLLTPELPMNVRAPERLLLGIDGPAVERAIANLVTNAVEHGAAPIDIEVANWGDVAAESVDIIVTDQGPGISPDRLPHIFDRYAGDHHGIGLAIVKQVADAYGSVRVESPIDDDTERPGTRFTLTLHPAAQ